MGERRGCERNGHTHRLRGRMDLWREHEEHRDEAHPRHGDNANGHIPPPQRERAPLQLVAPSRDPQEYRGDIRDIQPDDRRPISVYPSSAIHRERIVATTARRTRPGTTAPFPKSPTAHTPQRVP